MQFVSEKSKLYRWALQASSIKRYGATCGIISSICLIWYFLIFQRIQTITETRINAHAAHIEQLVQRTADQKRFTEFNKKIIETEKNISAIIGQYAYSDLFQAHVVNLLKSGIQLKSYVPGESKSKLLYDKDAIQVSFDATMNQLFKFFEHVQHADNLCCAHCVIACNNDADIYSCSCVLEQTRLKKIV